MVRRQNRPAPREARALVVTATYRRCRGWVAASILGGQGLHTQGRTLAEARRNLIEVFRLMLREAPHQLPRGPAAAPPTRGLLVECVEAP
jgi:hypothetical protein